MAWWRPSHVHQVEGTCARCHKDLTLYWMGRIEAYICDKCWRKILGI